VPAEALAKAGLEGWPTLPTTPPPFEARRKRGSHLRVTANGPAQHNGGEVIAAVASLISSSMIFSENRYPLFGIMPGNSV